MSYLGKPINVDNNTQLIAFGPFPEGSRLSKVLFAVINGSAEYRIQIALSDHVPSSLDSAYKVCPPLTVWHNSAVTEFYELPIRRVFSTRFRYLVVAIEATFTLAGFVWADVSLKD